MVAFGLRSAGSERRVLLGAFPALPVPFRSDSLVQLRPDKKHIEDRDGS